VSCMRFDFIPSLNSYVYSVSFIAVAEIFNCSDYHYNYRFLGHDNV